MLLASLVVSASSIANHLANFHKPRSQIYIVRILAMVPVYASTAWLSIWLPDTSWSLFFAAVRDSYEALVIYTFFTLLVNVLGGQRRLEEWLELQPTVPTPYGMRWLLGRRFAVGKTFLTRVRSGALQFVLVKPAMATFAILLYSHGSYQEGNFSPFGAYFYISMVTNTVRFVGGVGIGWDGIE